MLEVYRNEILSIADVLLPNQFEAEQLSGMKIENEEDGWKVRFFLIILILIRSP